MSEGRRSIKGFFSGLFKAVLTPFALVSNLITRLFVGKEAYAKLQQEAQINNAIKEYAEDIKTQANNYLKNEIEKNENSKDDPFGIKKYDVKIPSTRIGDTAFYLIAKCNNGKEYTFSVNAKGEITAPDYITNDKDKRYLLQQIQTMWAKIKPEPLEQSQPDPTDKQNPELPVEQKEDGTLTCTYQNTSLTAAPTDKQGVFAVTLNGEEYTMQWDSHAHAVKMERADGDTSKTLSAEQQVVAACVARQAFKDIIDAEGPYKNQGYTFEALVDEAKTNPDKNQLYFIPDYTTGKNAIATITKGEEGPSVVIGVVTNENDSIAIEQSSFHTTISTDPDEKLAETRQIAQAYADVVFKGNEDFQKNPFVQGNNFYGISTENNQTEVVSFEPAYRDCGIIIKSQQPISTEIVNRFCNAHSECFSVSNDEAIMGAQKSLAATFQNASKGEFVFGRIGDVLFSVDKADSNGTTIIAERIGTNKDPIKITVNQLTEEGYQEAIEQALKDIEKPEQDEHEPEPEQDENDQSFD